MILAIQPTPSRHGVHYKHSEKQVITYLYTEWGKLPVHSIHMYMFKLFNELISKQNIIPVYYRNTHYSIMRKLKELKYAWIFNYLFVTSSACDYYIQVYAL